MSKLLMKVIVISDSHSDPHPALFSKLNKYNSIIHCGDISSSDVIDDLKQYCSVLYAVQGNVESIETSNLFPEEMVIELEGLQIYVTHELRCSVEYFYETMLQSKYKDVKLVLFGHTHIPYKKKYKSVTFFNPGSIAPPRYNIFPSYGELHIYQNKKFKIYHKKIFDFSIIKRIFNFKNLLNY